MRKWLVSVCLVVDAAAVFAADVAFAANIDAPGGAVVDFQKDVLPIFERSCVDCHGPHKASGGVKLTSGEGVMAGGITGKSILIGNPVGSYLVQRLRGLGDEERMPLKANRLDDAEIRTIELWIKQGAHLPVSGPKVFVPAPAAMKRLTVSQYQNTVLDLLGPTHQVTGLEPDTLISGSAAVGAGRIGLSRTATESYGRMAADLARGAVADDRFRAAFIPCAASGRDGRAIDRGCLDGFINGFGRRAWRRPIVDSERARYVALGRDIERQTGGDSRRVFETLVTTFLASPNFIYRVEYGVPDPQDTSVPPRRILTDFELGARLSFFLWAGPPDDALLDAAARGELGTDDGLRRQAVRMLASPRARQTLTAFFTELLRLRRLDRLPQFRSSFAQVASPTLASAMRQETLKLIEAVVFDPDRDFRDIFSTRFTFVNAELAQLYGLPLPARTGPDGWARVSLPDGQPRTGILGHASFLALNAHPTSSSPTKRGKFIREVLLCQAVPPPPPNVSSKLPEDHEGSAARTTREKLTVHRTAPQCAGCHKAMDPMGLAFESFDGIGVFRSKEQGKAIDPSGELDGVAFKDAGELGTLLTQSSRVGVCVARNLFRFALGHLEEEGEEPLVDELALGLNRTGFRFNELVLNVVRSRGFRYLSDPE